MGLNTLFLVVSLILLILAAFGVNPRGVNLGWLGVAFFVLTFLIS